MFRSSASGRPRHIAGPVVVRSFRGGDAAELPAKPVLSSSIRTIPICIGSHQVEQLGRGRHQVEQLGRGRHQVEQESGSLLFTSTDDMEVIRPADAGGSRNTHSLNRALWVPFHAVGVFTLDDSPGMVFTDGGVNTVLSLESL